MRQQGSAQLLVGVCAALAALGFTGLRAQQAPAAAAGATPAAQGAARGGGGRGGAGAGGIAPALFTAADMNRDGVVTRAELMSTVEHWYNDADMARTGSVTPEQLSTILAALFPAPAARAGGAGRGGAACAAQGSHTPCPDDVAKMMAALPDKPYAKPAKPRKLLVYAVDNDSPAHGFVHASIALQAATMKAIGDKLGTWSTTVSYNPNDINTENLKQYDAILLDSTTGCFLDQPNDKAATDARRAALLAFVRGGKGIAGIHASTDSYHSPCPNDLPAAGGRQGGGAGFGRGGAAAAPGAQLAAQIVAQADKNADQKLTLTELTAMANDWFDKMDTDKSGRIAQADFAGRFALTQPAGAGGGRGAAGAAGGRGAGANAGAGGAPTVARGSGPQGVGSWPEFNKLIGGFFKFHWVDPQLITVKIDDPKSPLTVMFGGKEFEIHDETYTFAQDSFSRKNVHVLTSIDYAKMSDEDKAKEPAGNARMDGDYALSYIRREGLGRVFYEAHGHSERIYAMKNMNEHYLAGMQYALGDLKADDSPSIK
jgi:type 1 glutamine amidotransferase